MNGARRWTIAATVAAVLSALLPLVAARWAEGRFERARALRTAATTAAYLNLVTPAARRDSTAYDLSLLLVQARALTTLPGWTSQVEVYHRTAPLVDATTPPLPVAELTELRREPVARSWNGAALAPLTGRDGGKIVGAVAVRVGRRGVGGWLLGWTLPAALLAVGAAGAAVFRRRSLARYAAAALLLGLAAYVDVHSAARTSTDRWLTDTRLLLQEAATRLPIPRNRVSLADLAPLAGGGELAEARRARVAPHRVRVAGVPQAAVTARLGSGRWVELRTVPAEAFTLRWLVLLVGLALLGPPVVALLGWLERTAQRPRELRETAAAWGFLAPAGLHLAAFSLAPVLFVVYVSAHRWMGSPPEPTRPFVGLGNVAAVLRDPLIWISLRNTALYALYVPVSMAIALAVALILNRAPPAGRAVRLARTVFLLPYLSSVVAMALVWQRMDQTTWGLLGSPRTALPTLMLLSLWVQVGYQMAVFLTGLHAIPRAYYDAARVDGANAWQRFWRVTFPLLKPVTLFVLVTGLIGSFQVFTYVYVLTRGGPLHATDVVAHRIYRSAWEFQDFGYGSAVSLLLCLLLFGVTWTQFKLLGRRVEYA
ncbi:MAG TPA: sugar ABC transporter permease [Gemmatimonadales bacterium]|nr:sugar ABC transporter permease [Gemmatimonadales bacterium]